MATKMAESYVIITTAMGSNSQVLNEVKVIPEIKEIYTILGVYDFILRVQANSLKELKDVVSHIRRNRGVRSLLSLIVEDNR